MHLPSICSEWYRALIIRYLRSARTRIICALVTGSPRNSVLLNLVGMSWTSLRTWNQPCSRKGTTISASWPLYCSSPYAMRIPLLPFASAWIVRYYISIFFLGLGLNVLGKMRERIFTTRITLGSVVGLPLVSPRMTTHVTEYVRLLPYEDTRFPV